MRCFLLLCVLFSVVCYLRVLVFGVLFVFLVLAVVVLHYGCDLCILSGYGVPVC